MFVVSVIFFFCLFSDSISVTLFFSFPVSERSSSSSSSISSSGEAYSMPDWSFVYLSQLLLILLWPKFEMKAKNYRRKTDSHKEAGMQFQYAGWIEMKNDTVGCPVQYRYRSELFRGYVMGTTLKSQLNVSLVRMGADKRWGGGKAGPSSLSCFSNLITISFFFPLMILKKYNNNIYSSRVT